MADQICRGREKKVSTRSENFAPRPEAKGSYPEVAILLQLPGGKDVARREARLHLSGTPVHSLLH